jgi:hypothetical protein
MSFDSERRTGASQQQKERRLAMELLPPFCLDRQSSQVIGARHHFPKKPYENKYRWRPSLKIEAAIVRAIFGRD